MRSIRISNNNNYKNLFFQKVKSCMKKYRVFLASKKVYFEIILLTYPSRNRSHWGIFSYVLYIHLWKNKNKCLLGRSIYTSVLWVANGIDDEISFEL